jgi:hypothetical protein
MALGLDDQNRPTLAIAEAGNLRQDHLGIWWCPSQPDSGGPPQFAQLHPERQRRCMDELRCQVCAKRTGEPSTWLLDPASLRDPDGSLAVSIVNSHAPVCRACIPLAGEHCPAVRAASYVAVEADEVRPWGVSGDIIQVSDDRSVSLVPGGPQPVAQDDPRLAHTVAKQRWVILTGWRTIEV